MMKTYKLYIESRTRAGFQVVNARSYKKACIKAICNHFKFNNMSTKSFCAWMKEYYCKDGFEACLKEQIHKIMCSLHN